jgi:bifunctional DNA-binding transcriptional regulator/antitoxin component of YhaV-PrlF toxin-antitoxin module
MGKVKARKARLSRKNQITIPVAVLKVARVGPGDEMHVEAADDGRIVLTRTRDPLDEFVGDLPGLSEATNLQQLRDEWER